MRGMSKSCVLAMKWARRGQAHWTITGSELEQWLARISSGPRRGTLRLPRANIGAPKTSNSIQTTPRKTGNNILAANGCGSGGLGTITHLCDRQRIGAVLQLQNAGGQCLWCVLWFDLASQLHNDLALVIDARDEMNART